MLRLRAIILRVVHRQTAASNSASPEIIGQHAFAAGSPTPMCTSPPNKSTHAPSFKVSIGQVSFPDGGQGFFVPGDGFVMTGGTVTGGMGTAGIGTEGIGTAGIGTDGGMGTDGMGTEGMGTTGGSLIGGLTTGGRVMGGFPMIGGRVMGPLGDLEPEPGLTFLGGLLPQEPQARMGEAEEMKSMQMRKRE